MGDVSLRGIRVVDASECVPGQMAGRMLTDHGAEVLLVESSSGSVVRSSGPAAATTGGSLLFEHLNGGKNSLVVDAGDYVDTVRALARDADVVIASPDLATAIDGQVGNALVAVASEFSAPGCYAGWAGSELVHQALSGSMYYTGLADHEPLYGTGRRASYAAGVQLFIGIAAALTGRAAGRPAPQRIDVAVHEAAAAMEQNFSTQYSYNGTFPARGEKVRPKGHARCSDGWVVYFVRGEQWADFCETFHAADLIDDPRFATWGDLIRNWSAASAELHARASAVSTAEVFAEARRRKLVLAPMLTLSQLLAEDHLEQRGYWQKVDGPVPTALGPMFRFSELEVRRDRPAPQIGNADGFTSPRVLPAPTVAGTPARPLHGIRVLDLTSAWAGPMATRILASLGAEIIKIEGPTRPDSWRGEVVDPPTLYPYPDLEPGERPYDRHSWFNAQNQGKRSVALDLKQPEGLELARRIAAQSDVVIANWSPGALDRSGLGYADVSRLNPRIVVVEMPAISSDGELAELRGLGPTMEAMSGIAQLIGYPPDRPLGSGSAYLDPIGGLHGAAATVVALLARELTGRGQAVEVAQREAAMHWIGELILDAAVNGTEHGPIGNASPHAAPFGPYPTVGDDEWVAVDVDSDEAWQAFCRIVDPTLASDPRFLHLDDRVRARAELDEVVGRATRRWSKLELADHLQRAGVRAAPVQNGRDLFFDPHLRGAGWFTKLEHPAAGVHDYPGLPLRLDGGRLVPCLPSPCYGEHTDEVLSRLLGLGADEIGGLRGRGVVIDAPRGRGGH